MKYHLSLVIATVFAGAGIVHANWGEGTSDSTMNNATYEGRNDGGYGTTGVAGSTQGTSGARISNTPDANSTYGNSAYPVNSEVNSEVYVP